MKSFGLAVSTMVGTIIGAGIFGIPYVISKSGIVPSVFYFAALTFLVVLLHLFFGEICLRTEGKHRLVGYAHLYLGARGRLFASLAFLFVLTGTLLAYVILAGNFLEIVFSPFLPLSNVAYSLLFLLGCAFFIAQGRQLITKAEFFLNIGIFAVVGIIAFFAFPHIALENFTVLNIPHLFLPYGVILFALVGLEAIPEVASFLKDTKSNTSLKKVIITATILASLLCLVFALAVVGVSGTSTTEDALAGLLSFLGQNVIFLGSFFGVLTIVSSFLVIGNYMKNSLRHDFGVPTPIALSLVVFLPAFPFLLGLREFIGVIGVVGSVIGAVEGVLIIAIFQKAKTMGQRVPEFNVSLPKPVLFLMALLLFAGAVAELVL